MEEKRGRSLSVEGGNPASEHLAKTNGLQDAVHPVHADSIISMEKIQAHQKAREMMSMEELYCREDGGWAIMDGAASNGAKLCGLQDRWQKGKKAGHKHLGEKLVVRVEEGDWPQLRGHGKGTRGTLGNSLTTPRRREGARRPRFSMALRPSSRGRPTMPNVAL